MVKYQSTRGGVRNISFEDAVLMGLATDRGLIIPEIFPIMPENALNKWSKLNYQELAFEIMRLFIDSKEISNKDLKNLIKNSYSNQFRHEEITPVIPLKTDKNKSLYIMEMFHGPTFAFKDIALQFLGNLFEFFLERNKNMNDINDNNINSNVQKKKVTILGATSGDTGSSAIMGLRNKKNIDIVILYPYKKVSNIQERQMTTILDDNVYNVALKGTFDDCQAIVKKMFYTLKDDKRVNLGAVNSINWARILAQIVYYFYAYFRVKEMNEINKKICFSVPTGNFGDILAGFYAKKLGLPIDKLLVATNENDILHRFFTKGTYHRKSVTHTNTPSMDICVSSNFERYLFSLSLDNPNILNRWIKDFETTGKLTISGKFLEKAKEEISSKSVLQDEVVNCIQTYHNKYNYTLDPHSAIAVVAGEDYLNRKDINDKISMVIVATAHYGKFMPTVYKSLEENDINNNNNIKTKPTQHPILENLSNLPTVTKILDNDFNSVKKLIFDINNIKEKTTIFEYCSSKVNGLIKSDSKLVQTLFVISIVGFSLFTAHKISYKK